MKKIISMFLIVFVVIVLASCESKTENLKYNFYYMSTFIAIDIKDGKSNMEEKIEKNLENMFQMFHELATNMEELPNDTKYLENVYSINQKPLENLEIDQELYEMLEASLEYYNLTDGFFDISIGKIIDVWKNKISELHDLYEGSLNQTPEISDEDFQKILDDIDKIEVYEDPFTLSKKNDKFYIKLNYKDVKLDLGAVAKGYATQKAADYIEGLGFRYYSITSGSSSIVVGRNPDRENDIFIISLMNPIKEIDGKLSYGRIHVKDTSVTTSGNFEQYVNYKNLRYHHIISPETKKPAHYYHTVTIIGEDAGLLDALSTALFNMPPEIFDLWIEKYQNKLNIEVIRFNYDGTVKTYLTKTELRS